MLGISFTELLIIGVVALLALGPQKLPQLLKTIGGVMREFRKATRELRDQLDVEGTLREAMGDGPARTPKIKPPSRIYPPEGADSESVMEEPASSPYPDTVSYAEEEMPAPPEEDATDAPVPLVTRRSVLPPEVDAVLIATETTPGTSPSPRPLSPFGGEGLFAQPHREEAAVQPSKEAAPAVQPSKEAAPAVQPSKEAGPAVQPSKEAGPAVQPLAPRSGERGRGEGARRTPLPPAPSSRPQPIARSTLPERHAPTPATHAPAPIAAPAPAPVAARAPVPAPSPVVAPPVDAGWGDEELDSGWGAPPAKFELSLAPRIRATLPPEPKPEPAPAPAPMPAPEPAAPAPPPEAAASAPVKSGKSQRWRNKKAKAGKEEAATPVSTTAEPPPAAPDATAETAKPATRRRKRR